MKEINNDLLHEALMDEKPLLAFDENADYATWKAKIQDKYMELLGLEEIAKNACEIKVEIEEVVKQDGYVRYRYVFESEKGCYLPCYLLIPDTGKEKYPVLLCLQGHTAGFHISIGKYKYAGDERGLGTSTFALDGVKNGYAALCIEQRGMGERQTPHFHRGRVEGEGCPCYYTALTALLVGRTLMGERVWDVSRAIDSLAYFDHLDLDDITCVGQSGGGTATYYAACYDKRIKVAVPSCAVCSYKESIGYTWHCTCNYVPQARKYFDMGELAALIAPRKLALVNGANDKIFHIEGTREIYSVVEKIYEKEGAKDACHLYETPYEHFFDKNLVFGEIIKR